MQARTFLNSKLRPVITVKPSDSVELAMERLITNNIGCLPVVEHEQRLVGILSDKDIFRRIYETKGNYSDLVVSDLMTREVIFGLPEDEITQIAALMDKNTIRHVPIVSREKVIGMISLRDVIKSEVRLTEIENRYLKLYSDELYSRDKSADL